MVVRTGYSEMGWSEKIDLTESIDGIKWQGTCITCKESVETVYVSEINVHKYNNGYGAICCTHGSIKIIVLPCGHQEGAEIYPESNLWSALLDLVKEAEEL